MARVFISGHLDLTQDEFDQHYQPRILAAIAAGDSFGVGDARGADTLAQAFLARMNLPDWKVVVFHMFDTPRNNVWGFQTKGGFQTDEDRDAAMTRTSDEDIAWVRPGRERSGTAKNLARRNKT